MLPTDHKVSINNKNRRWKGWVSGLFQATPEVTFKEKSEFPRDNGEVGLGCGVGVEDVQAESKVEPRLPRRWHLCGWKDDAGSRDGRRWLQRSELQPAAPSTCLQRQPGLCHLGSRANDTGLYDVMPVKHSTRGLVPNPQLAKCCHYYDMVGGWCQRQGALMSRGPNARSVLDPETPV